VTRMTKKQYNAFLAKRGGVIKCSTPRPFFRDIQMRSTWETEYASYLDRLVHEEKILSWDYEPERFVLGDKCSYLPDFRAITNNWEVVYVEVKGYNRQAGFIKWKAAAALNLHAMFLMVRIRAHQPVLMNIAPHREMSVTPGLFGAEE
jgi:hypothetical protein